jgi:hypothetical protein
MNFTPTARLTTSGLAVIGTVLFITVTNVFTLTSGTTTISVGVLTATVNDNHFGPSTTAFREAIGYVDNAPELEWLLLPEDAEVALQLADELLIAMAVMNIVTFALALLSMRAGPTTVNQTAYLSVVVFGWLLGYFAMSETAIAVANSSRNYGHLSQSQVASMGFAPMLAASLPLMQLAAEAAGHYIPE